jgi:hypothetical protein
MGTLKGRRSAANQQYAPMTAATNTTTSGLVRRTPERTGRQSCRIEGPSRPGGIETPLLPAGPAVVAAPRTTPALWPGSIRGHRFGAEASDGGVGVPVHELCGDGALPAGAGRQDPAEQEQIKDQGNDEHQAPPMSRGAEHNDDYRDPNGQQQPDDQR